MTIRVRWLLSRLGSNYWFYPALFSVGAVALAFLMVYLDRNGFAEWLNDVKAIVPSRPQGASNGLTVIAGSMIGVASTVFSITIAAVAYASGTYGPRLLTNFMEDKGNQLSLATFIGTFVYAITVLRTVRAEDEVAASAADAASTALPGFVPQLSLLVAYLLMALSIAVLVFFLNHIPSSIRINTVLEEIGHKLLDDIRDEFPNENVGIEARDAPDGAPVRSRHTGYVQIIDFDRLDALAKEMEQPVSLEVRTGDFVHPGMAMIRVGTEKDDLASHPEEEKLYEVVKDAFTLGATRTPDQDPQFLVDELVEIALRALSPGINDPFTAITAMHWLGAATAELGCRDLRKQVVDEPEAQRLYPLPDDFEHYLKRGFGAVRSGVAPSHTAALVMLDTLRHTAAPIDDATRIGLLRREGDRFMEQVRLKQEGPDLQDIEARYVTFTQSLDR